MLKHVKTLFSKVHKHRPHTKQPSVLPDDSVSTRDVSAHDLSPHRTLKKPNRRIPSTSLNDCGLLTVPGPGPMASAPSTDITSATNLSPFSHQIDQSTSATTPKITPSPVKPGVTLNTLGRPTLVDETWLEGWFEVNDGWVKLKKEPEIEPERILADVPMVSSPLQEHGPDIHDQPDTQPNPPGLQPISQSPEVVGSQSQDHNRPEENANRWNEFNLRYNPLNRRTSEPSYSIVGPNAPSRSSPELPITRRPPIPQIQDCPDYAIDEEEFWCFAARPQPPTPKHEFLALTGRDIEWLVNERVVVPLARDMLPFQNLGTRYDDPSEVRVHFVNVKISNPQKLGILRRIDPAQCSKDKMRRLANDLAIRHFLQTRQPNNYSDPVLWSNANHFIMTLQVYILPSSILSFNFLFSSLPLAVSRGYLSRLYRYGRCFHSTSHHRRIGEINHARLIALTMLTDMQALGLHYLHFSGIVHGDIKAHNIGLDGRLKIMNFESATFLELGSSHRLINHTMDVWALGILICELLLGVVGQIRLCTFYTD